MKSYTISDLSIGAMFSDLERPITYTSRSRYYSTLTMSLTVCLQDGHIFRPTMDNM